MERLLGAPSTPAVAGCSLGADWGSDAAGISRCGDTGDGPGATDELCEGWQAQLYLVPSA